MITTGLWGGSSPGSIADIYALLFGADIISRQQGLLKTNIEYFKSIVKIEQFRYLPEFPVFMPLIMGTSKILLNHKIVISAFSYPTENDPLIERIVINASHTKEQIDQLVLTL